MKYRDVQFRSTLEADWAATLDELGIRWQYEPEAVRLPSGEFYRPDFYLPQIATWLEVKGPLQDGIGKAKELAGAVFHRPDCPGFVWDNSECCPWEYQLVVIGLAPVNGEITYEVIDLIGNQGGQLTNCGDCGAWWWFSWSGAYGCRAHRRYGWGDHDSHGGLGDVPPLFARAPRTGRKQS